MKNSTKDETSDVLFAVTPTCDTSLQPHLVRRLYRNLSKSGYTITAVQSLSGTFGYQSLGIVLAPPHFGLLFAVFRCLSSDQQTNILSLQVQFTLSPRCCLLTYPGVAPDKTELLAPGVMYESKPADSISLLLESLCLNWGHSAVIAAHCDNMRGIIRTDQGAAARVARSEHHMCAYSSLLMFISLDVVLFTKYTLFLTSLFSVNEHHNNVLAVATYTRYAFILNYWDDLIRMVQLAFRAPDTAAILCHQWRHMWRVNEVRRQEFPPAVHKFLGERIQGFLHALQDFTSSPHLLLFMNSLAESIALLEGVPDFISGHGEAVVISFATGRSANVVAKTCVILSSVAPALIKTKSIDRINNASQFAATALQSFPNHDGVGEFACSFLRKVLAAKDQSIAKSLNNIPNLLALVAVARDANHKNPQVAIVASQLYFMLTNSQSSENQPNSEIDRDMRRGRSRKSAYKKATTNRKRSVRERTVRPKMRKDNTPNKE